MDGHGVVPLRFDLSELVRRSVATFFSHLVTRPTGEALRLGIESQIGELGTPCLSVLDFSQVIVIDYSCADETVAKLIRRFQRDDRPAEAYFIARGVAERHRHAVEEALARHGLALVAQAEDAGTVLLGEVDALEREAWLALESLRRARPAELARSVGAPEGDAVLALERLARRRVVLRRLPADSYFSLTSLLER